jgi:hypothetical protein
VIIKVNDKKEPKAKKKKDQTSGEEVQKRKPGRPPGACNKFVVPDVKDVIRRSKQGMELAINYWFEVMLDTTNKYTQENKNKAATALAGLGKHWFTMELTNRAPSSEEEETPVGTTPTATQTPQKVGNVHALKPYTATK